MYEIRKHKTEIREYYLQKRCNLDNEVRATNNEKICKNMTASATFRYADVLLMYYPKPDEIDIRPIAEAAWAAGKKVAFPRCNPADHPMVFHFVNSFDELEPGSYNIMEPPVDSPAFDVAEAETGNVACVVPAVVFDKKGYRIGYGGGYYDKYLKDKTCIKIGLCYDFQIIDSIIPNIHDIPVDIIISEKRIINTHNNIQTSKIKTP